MHQFFEKIYDFALKTKAYERFSSIIEEALSSFFVNPEIRIVSLFTLNADNYEFEHKSTCPEGEKDTIIEKFSCMVEHGLVGEALEKGTIAEFAENDKCECGMNCMAVPLIANKGIVGLIIILTSRGIELSPELKKAIMIFSNLFANILENFSLNQHLKKVQEVLEQKVASRTMDLAKSRRELKAILDSVQVGILVVDNESDMIVRTNPVSAELLGEKEEELLGSYCGNYLGPYQNFISISDSKHIFEDEIKHKSGAVLTVLRTTSNISLAARPFRIESFHDISVLKKVEKLLKDTNELLELKVQERTEDLQLLVHKLKSEIAERERAENDVRQMLEKEIELNELKTRFITMVSHEFRTPLTVIRSAAQILDKFESELSEVEQKEYTTRIVKTVDIMTDLIENVLFIGKNDTTQFKSSYTKINLIDFCKSIIRDIQLSVNNNRYIDFSFTGECAGAVSDDKLLRLILMNLLNNAIKYSDSDKEVKLDLLCNSDNLIFTVTDYGIGIPQEEQEKIFEMFYRGNNVGVVTGAGLGMSVVLQSVQMLKGKIELFSKPGERTSFKIIIPNAKFITAQQ